MDTSHSTLRAPQKRGGQPLTLRIPARPKHQHALTSTFGSSRPHHSQGPLSRSWADGNGSGAAQRPPCPAGMGGRSRGTECLHVCLPQAAAPRGTQVPRPPHAR
eukprot:6291935-Alexandrium_andersonii.AAC.2